MSDYTKPRGKNYVDITNKTVCQLTFFFSPKNIISEKKSSINRKAYTFPMCRFLAGVTEEKNPSEILKKKYKL